MNNRKGESANDYGNGRAFMPDDGVLSKQEPKISAVMTHFGIQTITIYELPDKLNLSL